MKAGDTFTAAGGAQSVEPLRTRPGRAAPTGPACDAGAVCWPPPSLQSPRKTGDDSAKFCVDTMGAPCYTSRAVGRVRDT